MAAKVIPFTSKKKQLRRIIEHAVDHNLSHKNPQVLQCLKQEIEVLLEKHFNGEAPEMTLKLPADLREDQFQSIRRNFKELFNEHNERMIRRSNSIFMDLYLSRLEVCELKYGERQQD